MRRWLSHRGLFFHEIRDARYYIRDTLHASRDTNNEPYFAQYDIRITQYGSIKIEQLCKTNPISEKPKIDLNNYMTKDYENEPRLRTPGKQTQSNPILSAVALAKADSKGSFAQS
jgi:hypothetical protein